MVMSQGTYTFLTCFAGFWLIWGLIVLLCCFCSYLRRRVKRQQEERLREQSLRALELEPLHYEGYGGSPPGIAVPHRLRMEPHHHHHHHPHIPPPRPWSCRHGKEQQRGAAGAPPRVVRPPRRGARWWPGVGADAGGGGFARQSRTCRSRRATKRRC